MGVTLQCQCESFDEDLHHSRGVKGGRFEDEERILCLNIGSLIHCAPLVLIAIMVRAINTGRDLVFT